ncbi:hypothetical protein R3W88_029398 [Solanum pinnatisectum]|uniref:MADS-box domain-containing protein n=1 Tax=Solanum pinnatisectum TaxID=50273 RepID=A0AAV9K594_9SOLN|nr:hypothetical protein R3W88_029398 [Solanum pinnatisectum]
MGRAKIKMELIQDYKKRMTTLVTRKTGLVKKISELSILCDIKACMIIHEGNNHQIWPNDPNEVTELINLYKNQPFQGRTKRGKTLSNYFENDEKKRAGIKVEKDPPTWDSRFHYFENDEKKKADEVKVEKYPTWDSRFDYLSQKELQNLAGVVEKRMDKAKRKIQLLKSMNVHIGSSSLSHQQIWDNNLMNQTTLWPFSNVNSFTDYNNFFRSNIPISGVNNSMGAGMHNGLLTIEDYQFCNANYSMMIEAENCSANDGIGSSSTMQPMANNGVGSSSTMHPMENNGVGSSSTMQPMENNGVGSSSTMQPMGNNYGIGSTSTMQLMGNNESGSTSTMQHMGNNGIGSSSTMQPMDQYPFIYIDSTRDIASSLTMQPMENNGVGSSSTMQPMGNNYGIGSTSTMQLMGNNESGSTSTMQHMGNNGIGSSSTMQPMDQYPFIYIDSTRDIASSSTMQPIGDNGIGSSSTMQPMGNNGIGSTSIIQPMDQYPFMYNDSTHTIGSSSTVQPMDQYPFICNDSTHDMSYRFV